MTTINFPSFITETLKPSLSSRLKLIYRIWMKFSQALGTFNAYLILSAVFFLMLTPLALYFRLTRRQLLTRIDPKLPTYFEFTSHSKPTNFRRQF